MYRISKTANHLWYKVKDKVGIAKNPYNYSLGLKNYRNKDWHTGLLYFKKSIIEDNKHAPSYFKLGMCYFKIKDFKLAKKNIQQALELKPENTQWIKQLNQAKRHTGEPAPSARMMREAELRELIADPNCKKEVFLELSTILKKQSRQWQEIEIWKDYLNKNKGDAEIYERLGDALRVMNRFEAASDAYRQAINYNKVKNPNLYFKLGLMYEKNGKNEILKKISFDSAIQQDTEKGSKNYGIGVFYQNFGLWPEACEKYEEEIDSRKNHVDGDLLFKAGMAYDRCYDWKKAKEKYLLTLESEVIKPYWLYRLGFVCERIGEYKEAIQYYSRAVKSHSGNNRYWLYRKAYCLSKTSDYKNSALNYLYSFNNGEELLDYNIIIEEGEVDINSNKLKENLPINHIYWDKKAIELFGKEEYEESAKSFYQSLLRHDNHSPKTIYNIGICYLLLKKYKEASDILQDTRILQKGYGVPEKKYKENKTFNKLSTYTEFYEREKLDKNMILYESFHGASMSCNPLAIYKELRELEEFKKFTHVWVVNDPVNTVSEKYWYDENLVIISRESTRYLQLINKSKYVINNNTFPPYFITKEDQKYLNTWHGIPIKTLGKDIKTKTFEHKNAARNFLQATHIITPDRHTSNIILKKHDIENIISAKLVETGYPRVDDIYKQSADKNIKKVLGIHQNKKVVLYAPTYRGSSLGGGEVEIDKIRILLEKLSTNTNIVVLYRGHHMTEKVIKQTDLPATLIPADIDTSEILAITDILISDYSSVIFDFIPSYKPIILYAYDYEEYKEDRGLYFDLKEVSDKVCVTADEVSEKIDQDIKAHPIKARKRAEKFCKYEDGESTQRVIDFFFNDKDVGEKIDYRINKKNILMYAGALVPNGVTSSFKSFSYKVNHSDYNIVLAIDPGSISGHSERIEQLEQIDPRTQIIPRVGGFGLTIEESWLHNNLLRVHSLPSAEMMKLICEAYTREFKRNYGNSKLDIVIDFEGYVRYWAMLFALSKIDKKKIIYLHNDMVNEWKERFPLHQTVLNLYHYYDHLLSVSKQTMIVNDANISNQFSVARDKFCYSNNFIDPDKIKELGCQDINDPDLMLLSDGAYKFVNVARLSVEKGHFNLIEAFSQFLSANSAIDAQLYIIGDGPLRNSLQNRIQVLGLEEKVFLLGRKLNPFPFVKQCDCFIFSSKYEGQGLVLLESMVLGTPVVCTDFPCAHDVLEDGKLGLIVDNSVNGLFTGFTHFVEGQVPSVKFDSSMYVEHASKALSDIFKY